MLLSLSSSALVVSVAAPPKYTPYIVGTHNMNKVQTPLYMNKMPWHIHSGELTHMAVSIRKGAITDANLNTNQRLRTSCITR